MSICNEDIGLKHRRKCKAEKSLEKLNRLKTKKNNKFSIEVCFRKFFSVLSLFFLTVIADSFDSLFLFFSSPFSFLT